MLGRGQGKGGGIAPQKEEKTIPIGTIFEKKFFFSIFQGRACTIDVAIEVCIVGA